MPKRNPAHEPSILERNGVRLNLTTGEVVCDGIRVETMPIESDILQILMRSAGQVVSNGELIRALAGERTNPFDGNIDIHIQQLKHKLERGRRLIRTIAGTGYLFAAAEEHGANGYQLA